MALIKLYSYILTGLEWKEVMIEVIKNKSLPCIEIIWLVDTSIREAKERVRASIRSLWVKLPPNKIIVNLSPSWLNKRGTHLDLPIALSVYMLSTSSKNIIWVDINTTLFFWELGLDWSVKPIRWLLPMILSAMKDWWKSFVIPYWNSVEVSGIKWIDIVACDSISNLISGYVFPVKSKKNPSVERIPFQWISGHNQLKKLLCISVLWKHNILLMWPPWGGKSLLAKSIKNLVFDLGVEESLSTSSIHSLLWIIAKSWWIIKRPPFIEVHNTVTKTTLLWWWRPLKPWLISMAHNWVLFLDEILEFSPATLNWLRQPLEEKKIILSRLEWSLSFPCDFMVVATANPCPCWWYWSKGRSCICSQNQIKNYQKKLSGPLLDRMDIVVEVESEVSSTVLDECWDRVDWNLLLKEAMIIRDERVWELMSTYTNTAKKLLIEASDSFWLSTRALIKMKTLARTIADLHGSGEVLNTHVAEALHYYNCRLLVA